MPTLTVHRGGGLGGPPARSTPALRLVSSDVVRLAVAGVQPPAATGLRLLLRRHPDLIITGEAGSADELVELVRRTRPDVVLIDADMPGALSAARRLRSTHARVLLLGVAEDVVVSALAAGARGLLVRDAPAEELVRAVRVLARGDALLSPELARALLALASCVSPA